MKTDEQPATQTPPQNINTELTRLQLEQIKPVLWGSAAVAIVAFTILANVTERFWLLAWVGFFSTVTLARLLLHYAYKKFATKDHGLPLWLKLQRAGIMLGGLSWGAFGVLMVVTPSLTHQVLIALVLGGICINAMTSHSVKFSAYIAFVIPATLPLFAWQLYLGEPVAIGFAVTIALFTAMLIVTARSYYRNHLASHSFCRENRELVQKADADSHSKRQLMTTMSEDIRTPLINIIDIAQSSLDGAQSPEATRTAFNAIKRGGENLLHVIDAMLAEAKIKTHENDIDEHQASQTERCSLNPSEETPDAMNPITSTLLVDEPEFADLVETFVKQLPESVVKIKQLFQDQNWPQLKQEVHDLKGMGGGFGYPMLTDLAGKIESRVVHQDIETVQTLLEELDVLSSRVEIGLINHKQKICA